jgi:hypothetical protein
MRASRAMIMLALVPVLLVAACTQPDYTASFVRYETLQDGSRVAVVAPVAVGAQPSTVRALTDLGDLKPGELVSVREWGGSGTSPRGSPLPWSSDESPPASDRRSPRHARERDVSIGVIVRPEPLSRASRCVLVRRADPADIAPPSR